MAEIVRTVEQYTETVPMGRGRTKTYPVEIIRLRSEEPWQYEVAPGRWELVDAVTIFDAGKEGVSLVYTAHRDFSEEQRQAGRKHIQQVLARVVTEQGLWDKIGKEIP